jgi:hypothetical protein
LKHQNWTYVSVVYSKEVYGLNGYKNFKKQAGAAGVCIATSISIQNQGSLDETPTVELLMTPSKFAFVLHSFPLANILYKS